MQKMPLRLLKNMSQKWERSFAQTKTVSKNSAQKISYLEILSKFQVNLYGIIQLNTSDGYFTLVKSKTHYNE